MFHLLKIKYSHKLKPQTLSPMALWWNACKAKRLTSLKIYLAEVQSIFLRPHTFSTDKKAKRVLIRFEQSLASPHIVLHWILFSGWPHHLFRWRTGLWRCCREVCVRAFLRKEIVGLSPWIRKQTQRAGTLHQVITSTKPTFDPLPWLGWHMVTTTCCHGSHWAVWAAVCRLWLHWQGSRFRYKIK